MQQQDQKFVNTVGSQVPESSEEHKDKSCTARAYRAPQLFLIGKAVNLTRGGIAGQERDAVGRPLYLS
jgi:hypothetical protein